MFRRNRGREHRPRIEVRGSPTAVRPGRVVAARMHSEGHSPSADPHTLASVCCTVRCQSLREIHFVATCHLVRPNRLTMFGWHCKDKFRCKHVAFAQPEISLPLSRTPVTGCLDPQETHDHILLCRNRAMSLQWVWMLLFHSQRDVNSTQRFLWS